MTPQEQALRVRVARHKRIVAIRRTVAAISLAIFLAFFSTIYIQMAAGRDPVLGRGTTTTTTTTTADPSTTTDSTNTDSDTSETDTDTSTSVSESTDTPSSVTTSQS